MRREMKKLSASIKSGAIALVFLIIGFESASFIGRMLCNSALLQSDADTSSCGAVAGTDTSAFPPVTVARMGSAWTEGERYARPREKTGRRYETFDFNPNTATLEELQRLGLSEKQARSIINYRERGGRFRRPGDFARSYVVSDSLYERVKNHIVIPPLDINAADSAALDDLPGIGPYFASRIVEYRKELHGYSYKEQLMDIYNFDKEKFNGLEDLIIVGPSEPFRLWSLPEDSLALHPYIDRYAARSIVLYRENTPREEWSVSSLLSAGILKSEDAAKLSGCRLE